MSRTVRMYAPELMVDWSSLSADGRSISVDCSLGHGFIPVFSTEAELRRRYPTAPIIVIRISADDLNKDPA